MPIGSISTTITQNTPKQWVQSTDAITTGTPVTIIAGVADTIIRVYGILTWPSAATAGQQLTTLDGATIMTYLPVPLSTLYIYTWGGLPLELTSGNALQFNTAIGTDTYYSTVIYDTITG